MPDLMRSRTPFCGGDVVSLPGGIQIVLFRESFGACCRIGPVRWSDSVGPLNYTRGSISRCMGIGIGSAGKPRNAIAIKTLIE